MRIFHMRHMRFFARPAPVAIAAALVAACGLLIAGPLDPPAGPVTWTYKTLTEVEPRTAMNAVNTPGDAQSVFRITQPGSYYLTGNIVAAGGKHGITVTVSHVTIDLNGYAVDGSSNTTGFPTGVRAFGAGAVRNMVLKNGTVRGFRGYGIAGVFEACEFANLSCLDSLGGQLEVGAAEDCIARNIRVQATSGETGIQLGTNSIVVDCVVRGGTHGISVGSGVVSRCSVSGAGSIGIYMPRGTVSDCQVDAVPFSGAVNSGAIVIDNGGRVERCVVRTSSSGVTLAGTGSIVGCEFVNCDVGVRSGQFGGVGASIEGNHFVGCMTAGVSLQANGGHMVVGNRFRNTATPIAAGSGNLLGELLMFVGGGTLTRDNTHPAANIAY
jgi:hypothetical protein